MKSIYKVLSTTALSAIVCLSLALPASAQHDHPSGGGGGGGGRPSGGGGGGGHVSVAQPSRPASVSRPSVQPRSNNAARPNTNVQRGYNAPRQQGRIGATTRTGVTAQPYRTYQGSAYGRTHPGNSGSVVAYSRGGGYLPGHTAYHYNHGYYGSYYAPRLGFGISILPFGYYPFYFGDYQYFYSDGLFYQYNDSQYTVVEPPVGAEVTTLPSNAQSIVINGQQYYEVNGVYYEPITKDDGTLSYQVAGKDGELNTDDGGADAAPAAPQIGDVVQQLPPNSRKININGEKLYLSPDGIYYKAVVDQNNNTTYKIVGLPSDDDQGQPQGSDQGGQ